jgi:hypothetical protein
MPVMLSPHSVLSEVLWIFSRVEDKHKRLVVEQNPHFYKVLPTSPKAYGGELRTDPIETFQHEKISVLIDSPAHSGRVFLETRGRVRVFGNVWVPNEVIIFKGSCISISYFFSLSYTFLDVNGKLEGESVVGAAIQGIPNLWSIEEFPLSLASQLALSPNWKSPSFIVTATQITSAAGILIRDWREPIRRMSQSRDVNIRITDKPPSGSSSSVGTP